MMRAAARHLIPRAWRLSASRAVSTGRSRRIAAEIAALARHEGDVVVGPWLGEVGFELLYWVPFLQWAVDAGGLDRRRLVVVSRGGTGRWYRHVTDRYADVFDEIAPDAFASRNAAREREIGEQKQRRETAFEREIVAAVADRLGLRAPRALHPGAMYAVMEPYWWGHRGADWVERHATFRRLDVTSPDGVLSALPAGYAAVKFYFNDCFPATDENRALATRVVRTLAESGPVVSLSTGLRVDDHVAWDEEVSLARHGIQPTAAANLDVQTQVVAGARVWAGTYGGFAYLAPFHGVPAIGFFSRAEGYSVRHLELARRVFASFGDDLLQLNRLP